MVVVVVMRYAIGSAIVKYMLVYKTDVKPWYSRFRSCALVHVSIETSRFLIHDNDRQTIKSLLVNSSMDMLAQVF